MNIDENVIFRIAKSESRSESILLVSSHLAHSYTTLSDNLRNEILFDSILDLIHFCLKKGFSLGESAVCCSIFYTLIKKFNLTSNSITLAESLDLFSSNLIQLSNVMNKNKVKEFIDYMNLTFFTHFNLFKFVFLNERENHIQNEKRFVNCPNTDEEVMGLWDAKIEQQWEYDESQKKLDNAGKLIKEKYLKERIILEEKEKILKSNLKSFNQEDELTEQLIEHMINEISLPIVDVAYQISKKDIDEFSEMKEIYVQKNNLVKPEPIAMKTPVKKGTVGAAGKVKANKK